MGNSTNLQNQFKMFYRAVATATVLKEEFARLVSQSTGQNYQETLDALDVKINERLKADSLHPQEPE